MNLGYLHPRARSRVEIIVAESFLQSQKRGLAGAVARRDFFEFPFVLQAVHQLVFRLLAEGKANGLRIDHPDGLWDPTSYFRQLQENFLLQRVSRADS